MGNVVKYEQPSKSVSKSPPPSLPTWAAKMHGEVFSNTQRDTDGAWHDADVLHTLPTPAQRLELKNLRAQLASSLEQTPLQSVECDKATYGLVAALMMAKPARAGGANDAIARSETYEMALDDVPTWAVRAAIRQWHRGECDVRKNGEAVETFDYKWAPESADLRNIAMRFVYLVQFEMHQIDKILNAIPFVDCSEVMQRNRLALLALRAGKASGLSINEAAEVGKSLSAAADAA
jgi:hypothetical protein